MSLFVFVCALICESKLLEKNFAYLTNTAQVKQDLCCCLSKGQKSMASCDYAAPLFAIPTNDSQYLLVQGNCNHWDCGRCGILRAKHEYGRIVQGAVDLAEDYELWFITLTCKGRHLSVKDAQENYLEWTNRFLTAARTRAARRGQMWSYVQVTERQKRGHPHSHILTTFTPGDTMASKRTKWHVDNAGRRIYEQVDLLRSKWLQTEVLTCGLGSEYDISKVKTVQAASRYVAKYLFKDSMLTKWPPGWKRVRYSQSWPKMDTANTDAIPVVDKTDIMHLALHSKLIVCDESEVYNRVLSAINEIDLPYHTAKVTLRKVVS
jgi:hypothetical protein